jgi:prevent-host-death family protein
VPAGDAKDTLSGLVDEAESTHQITITRHGNPAAM